MSKENPRRTNKRFNSETDFNPSALEYGDWREELQRFLIAGGILGKKQSQIVTRLNRWTTAKEIVEELEALWHEKKVEKFEVPQQGSGRPSTIWRATTKLLGAKD
jgi:hypothetical protein